jgi:SAM-dependent methyltransferase
LSSFFDDIYVCPQCKASLTALRCSQCGEQYVQKEGVTNFLPRGVGSGDASSTSANYDSIYTDHEAVWEDQGRGPEFRRYVAALLARLSTGRVLEVGCGEGYVLREVSASAKYAVDISPVALVRAHGRTGAQCSAAIGEMLPFANSSMDLVFSIGVMEHVLNLPQAMGEAFRVLRPGGHHVVLVHVTMTMRQRIRQKIHDYLLPPRPLELLRWLKKKAYRPIHQPACNRFTLESGGLAQERAGFSVEQVINLETDPTAPLAGPHVVIYVCRKP